ncbi:MAG: acyl-CoA thioesterase II [Pseudomonadales bacterium]|jgi:acyl-CoA thioesterase-2|nr:acyl-CoA thioesterase II [Pseudomonadales bacterium]
MTTNTAPLEELVSLLDLEQIDSNLFRGHHPAARRKRLFGGQIIAQALMAAARTVEAAHRPHSLHAYFLKAGDWRIPAVFEVDRIRDGRSFSTRRVVVIQNGEAIFNMDASFHCEEPGLEHQYRMPSDYTPPDESRMVDGLKQRPFLSFREDHKALMQPEPQSPEQHVWLKANGQVPDDDLLNMALLAYQSDEMLLSTARLPHRGSYVSEQLQGASLDHAIWFHHPVSVNDWLLYSLDSPSTSHARGFTRGEIYTADGLLVASCIQEGLMRMQQAVN